jgi:hypothetical protein
VCEGFLFHNDFCAAVIDYVENSMSVYQFQQLYSLLTLLLCWTLFAALVILAYFPILRKGSRFMLSVHVCLPPTAI